MACLLTHRSQDYARSIGTVPNSQVSSRATLVEPRNPNFHFTVNDISVMDPFELFPSYFTEETTPAMLSTPVAQQRQSSESMDDRNFGYVLRSPTIQSVSQ